MSQNIIHTILQQTYRFSPPQYTDAGVPIRTSPESSPFLGQGYYFWDNNIERARNWGRTRCGGLYHILQGEQQLSGEAFLDLVGSREDIQTFFKIYQHVCDKMARKLKMCEFFTIARDMETHAPGTFPFHIIRALEIKRKDEQVEYRTNTNSFFLLNPSIIVCFYNTEDIQLLNATILTA